MKPRERQDHPSGRVAIWGARTSRQAQRRDSRPAPPFSTIPPPRSSAGQRRSGNWTRSTSNVGYDGDNYQTQAATDGYRWARWTRASFGGYYNVYLRWSAAATALPPPPGDYQHSRRTCKYVNQRVGGGTWYSLGRYRFSAGYATGAGSVTLWATGANGYVVADAVIRRLTVARHRAFRVLNGQVRARPKAGPARYLRAHPQGGEASLPLEHPPGFGWVQSPAILTSHTTRPRTSTDSPRPVESTVISKNRPPS